MEDLGTYELASADIAAEEFDGEFVVLDLATGRYFSVVGLAATVWRGLVGGYSASALCAGLAPDDERFKLIAAAADALVAHGLLRRTGQVSDAAAGELAAALSGAEPRLQIDVFEDLADLLVADPIHDVDAQAGWPHRPAVVE